MRPCPCITIISVSDLMVWVLASWICSAWAKKLVPRYLNAKTLCKDVLRIWWWDWVLTSLSVFRVWLYFWSTSRLPLNRCRWGGSCEWDFALRMVTPRLDLQGWSLVTYTAHMNPNPVMVVDPFRNFKLFDEFSCTLDIVALSLDSDSQVSSSSEYNLYPFHLIRKFLLSVGPFEFRMFSTSKVFWWRYSLLWMRRTLTEWNMEYTCPHPRLSQTNF